jgi:hypothetical protein
MTSDDLKRLLLGQTLFRLDTILSPRLVPVLYAMGLLALLLWAVAHLFATFGSSFGNGLWGLLEIIVYGLLGLVGLRVVCEALLVYFAANEEAADRATQARASSSLLDEVRDALHEIAQEEGEELDDEDLFTPATDPLPDPDARPARTPPRRTARRTPLRKA